MSLKALFCSLALASGLVAQSASSPVLSASFPVNPVPMGSTVAMEVTAVRPVTLSTGCGIAAVRAGSPAGPIVFQPFICPFILLRVGPGASRTVRWNGSDAMGNPVAAGTYFIEVSGRDQAGTAVSAHFPVRIDDPALPPSANGPVLAARTASSSSGNPSGATGARIDLTITDPGEPGGVYFLAAAATSNQGITLPGGEHIALDPDLIFDLSFPVADPVLFPGFVGVLDSSGRSSGAAIVVPAGVLPVGYPLAVQGVVIGNLGSRLTNAVSLRTL